MSNRTILAIDVLLWCAVLGLTAYLLIGAYA